MTKIKQCARIELAKANLMEVTMKLNELEIGKNARIVRVDGEGTLRRHLLDMGLTPHTVVSVTKIAPMGDPIQLHLRGYELTIRKDDAGNIEIEEETV